MESEHYFSRLILFIYLNQSCLDQGFEFSEQLTLQQTIEMTIYLISTYELFIWLKQEKYQSIEMKLMLTFYLSTLVSISRKSKK